MHSTTIIILVFSIINVRLISALPTHFVAKSTIDNVIAMAHQGSTSKAVDGGYKALELRGGGGAAAGSSTIITEGAKSSPQLKPLYIALIILACIVCAGAIIAFLLRCMSCTSACKKQRRGHKQEDSEKGVVQPTTMDTCVAVPEAAVTKPANIAADDEEQARSKIQEFYVDPRIPIYALHRKDSLSLHFPLFHMFFSILRSDISFIGPISESPQQNYAGKLTLSSTEIWRGSSSETWFLYHEKYKEVLCWQSSQGGR
ncbi:hypothetical protein F4775DRAFT_602497 [Biscogniauxia sp. FL1348]|nr:hypothetical protein F4775DRAFT_602497 [Biscogniauxia sp. FL1348]